MNKATTSDLNIARRFAAFLKSYTWQIIFALTCALCSSAAGIALPLLAGSLINKLQETTQVSSFFNLHNLELWSLVSVFAFQAVCSYCQVVYTSRISEGVVRDIRIAAFSGLLKKEMLFFDQIKVGDVSSRVSKDVNDVQELYTESFQDIFLSIIEIFGSISAMLYISWKMTLLTLCVAPLSAALVLYYRNRFRMLARSQAKLMGDISSHAQEASTHIRIIRAFGAETVELKRMLSVCDKFYTSGISLAKVFASQTVASRVLVWVAIFFVMLYGFYLIALGDMNSGQLVAFLILAYKSTQPVLHVSYIVNNMQRSLAAASRVYSLLEDNLPSRSLNQPLSFVPFNPQGQISFDRVNFSYYGEDVLNDVVFSVDKGEFVALVGPSGAGKTTILKLLLGFYSPSSGRILLDDVDISRVDPAILRSAIAYVPQESMLFNRSIYENIAYGNNSASFAEIESAAKNAGALDFIRTLPQGFDTMVGELGARLSGGERQRIVLGRAFLRNPKILLLDEPTSNLDSNNEALLKDNIKELAKGRTTVMVAHRFSTIEHADRVIVINSGRVIESGSPQQLIQQRGLFYQMRMSSSKIEDLPMPAVSVAD